jgi:arylsulfatase A-like enzyme
VITLPEVLQAHGYRTAGLTTNVNVAPQFNFGQGFDEYTYLEPHFPFFTSRVSRRFAVVAVLYRVRLELSHVYYFPNERYRDAATLNGEALAWLEANRQGRFFLFLHYMDPHAPYYAHPYDFDLQADPGEQQNLAEREPDAAQALRAALDQVMTLAASQAVVPQTGELDAATRERLRQLGY